MSFVKVYHVGDAEAAARQFDFSAGEGHGQIKALLSHVCLGELRAAVSGLTMDECVQQRKTTLTDTVASALRGVERSEGEGPQAGRGWGIELDVVQVAQVFIVDQELRRHLEAEVRNALKGRSELSEIQTREGIQVAQAASARRLQQEELEAERERARIDLEKLRLQKEHERAEIEAETPNQLLRIQQEEAVLQRQLDKHQLELRVRELAVRLELLGERARQDLRKEILPLEQAPEIARALSRMLQGAHLSVYGQDTALLAYSEKRPHRDGPTLSLFSCPLGAAQRHDDSLTPILDFLADTLGGSRPRPDGAGEGER
jgi:hypothetical protein